MDSRAYVWPKSTPSNAQHNNGNTGANNQNNGQQNGNWPSDYYKDKTDGCNIPGHIKNVQQMSQC